MDDAPDPHTFYTELLPRQIERALREQERNADAARRTLEGMRTARGTIRAVVGEQSFWLRLEGGALQAVAEPPEPPLLTLLQEPRDFERLVRDAGDSPLAFLGGLAGSGGALHLTRARLEALGALRGSVHFEVAGPEGFRLLARFGPDAAAPQPEARIRVEPEVYAALRRGALDAQTAFMEGKLAIEGDVGLALQVALAALTPD